MIENNNHKTQITILHRMPNLISCSILHKLNPQGPISNSETCDVILIWLCTLFPHANNYYNDNRQPRITTMTTSLLFHELFFVPFEMIKQYPSRGRWNLQREYNGHDQFTVLAMRLYDGNFKELFPRISTSLRALCLSFHFIS